MRKYFASRHGTLWHESSNWRDFMDWCHKNVSKLDEFDLYTSDYEGPCCDPSCGCSADNGFTEAETDEIEEVFGILV